MVLFSSLGAQLCYNYKPIVEKVVDSRCLIKSDKSHYNWNGRGVNNGRAKSSWQRHISHDAIVCIVGDYFLSRRYCRRKGHCGVMCRYDMVVLDYSVYSLKGQSMNVVDQVHVVIKSKILVANIMEKYYLRFYWHHSSSRIHAVPQAICIKQYNKYYYYYCCCCCCYYYYKEKMTCHSTHKPIAHDRYILIVSYTNLRECSLSSWE